MVPGAARRGRIYVMARARDGSADAPPEDAVSRIVNYILIHLRRGCIPISLHHLHFRCFSLPLHSFILHSRHAMLFNFKKLFSLTAAVTTLAALSTNAAPTSLEKRAQCSATLATSAVRASLLASLAAP